MAYNHQTDWTNGTYKNNFANSGSGEQVLQYRKIGDKVQVRGRIQRTSGTSVNFFQLPEGYRPTTGTEHFPVLMDGGYCSRCYITTSGEMNLDEPASTSFTLVQFFISFSLSE